MLPFMSTTSSPLLSADGELALSREIVDASGASLRSGGLAGSESVEAAGTARAAE